ncbi:MAG: sensor histidine kinase [Acidimicrobiales bacterium]
MSPKPVGHSRLPARLSPLGVRLALAFVAVALAALALLVGLALASVGSDVSTLAAQQRADVAKAVAAASASAYRVHDSWGGAVLSPALAVATDTGGEVQISDASGHLVATSGGASKPRESAYVTPVMVDGARVGTVSVRIGTTGLGAADRQLRQSLTSAVAGAAGLAALLALVVAVFVSVRITRPLLGVIGAARAMAAGNREARVGQTGAPGELGDLAEVFDHMADSLDREDQLRRALVADVAHELRTPLAVLQASCEALADGVIEPGPDALSSLRDETLRLSRMVEDLEALSQAAAAGLSLVKGPVDLARVVGAAADALALRFEAAGVALERDLAPVVVQGDPTRLHQVVANLLTNAIKFTPAGGRVTLQAGPGPDGRARVVVGDTGVGIPPDELPHIFDRFWRGSSAGRVTGTGIGLAVVAELVAAHGGEVEATSQPGSGTRIVVELPQP